MCAPQVIQTLSQTPFASLKIRLLPEEADTGTHLCCVLRVYNRHSLRELNPDHLILDDPQQIPTYHVSAKHLVCAHTWSKHFTDDI